MIDYSKETKTYLKAINAILSCTTPSHIRFMEKWVNIARKKKAITSEDLLARIIHKLNLKRKQVIQLNYKR